MSLGEDALGGAPVGGDAKPQPKPDDKKDKR